jgi:hypothetical protein
VGLMGAGSSRDNVDRLLTALQKVLSTSRHPARP